MFSEISINKKIKEEVKNEKNTFKSLFFYLF